MSEGWIKLHRKLLDWEWFQDGEMVHLFIYFLLKANYEDKKWKGVDVRRGQLVTGLYKIKNDTGLSIQKIRTCIRRMEREKNPKINKQSNNQYTIITVCNYDSYQGNGINATNEITNEQQTNNKPITTTKEYKEEEEKKEVNISFDRFWDLYEKKVGKKDKIEKRWNKLTDDEREKIIEYLPKYKKANPNKKFRKNPETFLNNESWNDEIIGLEEEKPKNIRRKR